MKKLYSHEKVSLTDTTVFTIHTALEHLLHGAEYLGSEMHSQIVEAQKEMEQFKSF